MNMKTWTNPTVEELEVEETAGGRPWWFWEDRKLGPVTGDNNNNNDNNDDSDIVEDNTDDNIGDTEFDDEETTDGLS